MRTKTRIFKKINRTFNSIRIKYWSLFFGGIGKGSRVLGRIKVYNPENIEMGGSSTLNEGVLLNARGKIKIGDHVHISPFCIINTGGLDYGKTMDRRSHISKPVEIRDGVWIGSGVIVNPGVVIGKNSVIGAGSVVSSSISENSVAVGVPAKVIKKISD